MKNIKEMLDAVVEPIKLGDNSGFSNFLTEESDFEETRIITEEDDPFGSGGDAGGDAGGDPFGGGGDAGSDAGGGGDPFGSDMGGGGSDGEGVAGAKEGSEDADDEDKDTDQNAALTDGSHEPDP